MLDDLAKKPEAHDIYRIVETPIGHIPQQSWQCNNDLEWVSLDRSGYWVHTPHKDEPPMYLAMPRDYAERAVLRAKSINGQALKVAALNGEKE